VKSYFVYMVLCSDGTYYVGITNDLDRRIAEHELGIDPTCYTYRRRPVKLVYASEHQWVEQALENEKKIKGWSHRKKSAWHEVIGRPCVASRAVVRKDSAALRLRSLRELRSA
jgi:predicted GIY-YIG superfamily endonuclease